jgi:hypothetical protein
MRTLRPAIAQRHPRPASACGRQRGGSKRPRPEGRTDSWCSALEFVRAKYGTGTELSEREETAAVLKFFDRCSKFWSSYRHLEDLAERTTAMLAGEIVDFGATLSC